MTQSEGNKQGGAKKRKTDMGDVVGKIGIIWCSAAIVWQVIDLVILHGADKLYETLHMDYFWIGLWGITNAMFWLAALLACNYLNEIRRRETITVGVQILGTVVAVVAARIIVWEYSQIVARMFTAFYYQEVEPARVILLMIAWFFAADIIICFILFIFSYIFKV